MGRGKYGNIVHFSLLLVADIPLLVVRLEWLHACAARDRWLEELHLLKEELRRLPLSFRAEKEAWNSKRESLPDENPHSHTYRGYQAYARRQARVYESLELEASRNWGDATTFNVPDASDD